MMILPNLLPRQSRRNRQRHAQLARQLPGGIGEQFTESVKLDADRTSTTTLGHKTQSTGTGTIRQMTTLSISSTVSRPSSGTTSIPISSSHSSSSRSVTSSTSQAIITSVVVVDASTSQELIFVTSFPSDFPVPTREASLGGDSGRGYVFIPHSEVADRMLLFVTFCAAFFLFTILLIKLTRLSEKRQGVAKEDQMVGEDMRWQEGREVIEKKIVWELSHTVGPPAPGQSRPVGAAREGSKLARRQSWGNKA